MADPLFSSSVQSPAHVPRIKEFFLARQPILDREGELYAYELLFRSAASGPATITDDLAATAAVIAHAAELGMENVIGASLAFINVNAELLFSDLVQFLPRRTVILEILETVEVDDALVARVRQLAAKGYRFALDDVTADSPRVQRLLPLVDIIKVDLVHMPAEVLVQLATRVRQAGKKLLAEKVETQEQLHACAELGFDYFQGFYFAKPVILTGKKLPPAQAAIIRLMSQLSSDVDIGELEATIKQDPALGIALLRLVNAPAAGIAQPVESLGQALQLLGRSQLRRWLQILVYAEPGAGGNLSSPLLMLATTRGRLLELVAQVARPDDRSFADVAFTVGMMSLMDALFGVSMSEVLDGLSVADEIRHALLEREGVLGDMLRLAECIEQVDDDGERVTGLLARLGLTLEDFNALQLQAFEWSGALAHLK